MLCWTVPAAYFRRKGGRPADAEDFVGICYMALVKADRSFDPARGLPWPRYAVWKLWNAITDELRTMRAGQPVHRRQYRKIAVGSIDALLSEDGDAMLRELIEAPDPSPAAAVQRLEDRDELATAMVRHLTRAQLEVIALRYFEHMTQREVAALIGVTDSRVSQIERAGLRRLRSSLLTNSAARRTLPA